MEKRCVNGAGREPGQRSSHPQCDSCNKFVERASAKFANMELQARELHETAKAIVGGARHEFDNIQSTSAISMKEVEPAVATVSVRMSALEGHATKVVTQHQVAVNAEAMQRVSALVSTTAGGLGASGSGSAPSGTLTRGYCPEENKIPETFEGELSQWRSWRDAVADFWTHSAGMLK